MPARTRVAIVEHPDMPRPLEAFEDRREAVHRDDDRRPAVLGAAFELGCQAIVVWPEDLLLPGEPVGRIEVHVAGDGRRLRHLDDRARHQQVAVAVDHQARIDLHDERRIERCGDLLRHRANPDVPGDVTLELALRHAEPPERLRDDLSGVVGGQEERRRAVRIEHDDRIRLVVGEKLERRRLRHAIGCRGRHVFGDLGVALGSTGGHLPVGTSNFLASGRSTQRGRRF